MTTRARASGGNQRYTLRRKLYHCRHLMKSASTIQPATGPAAAQTDTANETEVTLLRETILRQRAEFDNFRKRAQREKEIIREAASEGILSKLLPVIDNLDRAISSSETSGDVKSVRDGVCMISTQLHRTLEAEGLRKVDALHQQFDPTMHDALVTEERLDVEANHVSEVLMPGYTYKEKLLRPAMVKVAKAPAGEIPPTTE